MKNYNNNRIQHIIANCCEELLSFHDFAGEIMKTVSCFLVTVHIPPPAKLLILLISRWTVGMAIPDSQFDGSQSLTPKGLYNS